jgi:hypothetical protein
MTTTDEEIIKEYWKEKSNTTEKDGRNLINGKIKDKDLQERAAIRLWRMAENAAFSSKEKAAAKRTEEICDNCEKIKELAEINYLTRRQKVKLILCKECLDNFAEMVVELAEPEQNE